MKPVPDEIRAAPASVCLLVRPEGPGGKLEVVPLGDWERTKAWVAWWNEMHRNPKGASK